MKTKILMSASFAFPFRCVRMALMLSLVAAGALSSSAQMVTGSDMKDFARVFGVAQKATFDAKIVSGSAPGNILWPGEQPRFTFQIADLTGQALRAKGRVRLVSYGTQGIEGDIWTPQVVGKGALGATPITVNFKSGGFQNFTIAPRVPAKLGAYALVVDVDGRGSRFLTSFVRTFKADSRRIQYPHFCLDNLPLPVLKRLGVQAIRLGVEYKPTTDADFAAWYAALGKEMADYKAANIAVLFMVGGGAFYHPNQPLGRPRPWLDDKDTMMDTKFDLAWLPSYDADFEKYTRRFATDFGWPRGPINAFSLWNEPWEGISISGWGADMPRYREMYRHMVRGVLAARKTGVRVLVGGADSTSNALDKFFPDESKEFVPIFDFLSIHYQGLASSANMKLWRERKGPNGRVKIWDTESWVANTDDRVAAVVATNRAAGYDRAMGVYGGNVAEEERVNIRSAQGEREIENVTTWSVAAAIGASQHFIGERPFKQLVFQNGLPWVMQFDGENKRSEDGTLVVVGDLSDAFGANNLLYRTARGQREIARKAQLKKQLAALPLSQKEPRQKIMDALAKPDVLSGATMTISNPNREFVAYDFYGNALSFPKGTIRVPLDGRGFFLRANNRKGAFARLLNAVRASSVNGIEPLATVVHDFTSPISSRPTMKLELTNVLNRAVSGALSVNISGLKVAFPPTLRFAPNQTRVVDVKVVGGAARADNEYSMSLRFNGGNAGVAVHEETVRVNVVQRRRVVVDGDLSEWRGAIPQIVRSSGSNAPDLTEAAWFPFKKFDAKTTEGLASGYLAYDADNFYFAAKIADNTPDEGNVRFATRDDAAYFYPKVSFYKAGAGARNFAARWSGEIEASKSGDYVISTITDDGVRLWLDDKLVIDKWIGQGATEYRTILKLTAKQRVRVRMEYFQGEGGHSARLLWQPPGEAQSAIPNSALFVAGSKNGLTAEYFIGTSITDTPLVTRIDPNVDFTWADNKSPDPKFDDTATTAYTWPEGVRRYSYRRDPDLPAGNFPKHDNVQIAFNVLPESQKKMLDKLPGTPPKFTTYADTDYEYALNAVAPKFGGGTEIWRLRSPQLPEKHFYPRQPKSRFDGPVKGRLVMKRDGNTRIVEAAIPWSEIPAVKRRLDLNLPIKFSFRVNDNEGGGTMELSRERSVARRNGSFKVDWVEHWANELQFGWMK